MFAEENLGLGKGSAETFVCTKLLEFGYPNFTTTCRQAAVNYLSLGKSDFFAVCRRRFTCDRNWIEQSSCVLHFHVGYTRILVHTYKIVSAITAALKKVCHFCFGFFLGSESWVLKN